MSRIRRNAFDNTNATDKENAACAADAECAADSKFTMLPESEQRHVVHTTESEASAKIPDDTNATDKENAACAADADARCTTLPEKKAIIASQLR